MPTARIPFFSALCFFWLVLCSASGLAKPLTVISTRTTAITFSSVNWPATCRLRIEQERQYLLSKKTYLESRLQQSAPVIRYIGRQLKKMRLPEWLVWLPLLESSYRSQVVSSAGAAGVWQLMPETAIRFGLQVSSMQDERVLLTRSTEAALRYLQWLADYFAGDWALALAGYNAGEMRVKQAQEKGQQTAYCDLALPAETQRYVPRLLALLDIIQHARHYGLQLPAEHAGTMSEIVFSAVIDITPAPPLLVLDAIDADPLIINKAAGLDMDNHAPDWQKKAYSPP